MVVLQLLLTMVLLQSIVKYSNDFAASKLRSKSGLSVEELQAFIGMNIVMGMLQLPQVRDYWATSGILDTPWFASIMTCDRFYAILRYLHLVDSSLQKKKGEDGYDALFKVHTLTDHLSAVFPRYQPGQCMSVDEMMIGM